VDFAPRTKTRSIRYNLLKEKRRELTSYRGDWRVLIAWKALFESFPQLCGSPFRAHRALKVTNYRRKGVYSAEVPGGSVEHATGLWNLLWY